jgi:hypothetical protein
VYNQYSFGDIDIWGVGADGADLDRMLADAEAYDQ